MCAWKVLVADGEPSLLRLIETGLASDEIEVRSTSSGVEALAIAREWQPDLVLLDVLMPDLDGHELCRRLRLFTSAPVIQTCSLYHERNQALGLDAGADEYVSKPFSIASLKSQVESTLSLAQWRPVGAPTTLTLDRGRLVVDLERQVAYRRGRPVPLSNTQFRLLACLAGRAGEPVPLVDVVTAIWGADSSQSAPAALRLLASLRERLEDNPEQPRYLEIVGDELRCNAR